MAKRVTTLRETESGRNVVFKDNWTGHVMTAPEFVRRIQVGQYPNYHVRTVHGRPTPVSNPDGKPGNNLD